MISTSKWKTVAAAVFAAAPLFAGCAPYGSSYAAPADPYYDGRAAYDAPRPSADEDCRRYAHTASGNTFAEVGKGAVVGGAVGAAAGAAAGAIAGDAGKGAAIGAATGGIGGAAVQGVRKNETFNDIYASCMRDRGYDVY
ncbi:MAG TPA: glycine zipper family protein [Terriglobales bacterium]|nr:glycine zipper family protein [Terriglobales bacterium]